ncbi:MAG: hypothetical protein Q9169_008453, partial [Polycauliona sp. 2 TL-2023]
MRLITLSTNSKHEFGFCPIPIPNRYTGSSIHASATNPLPVLKSNSCAFLSP